MPDDKSWSKKIVGGIYSYSADKLYEPIVVRRAFPLLGGDLNDLALAQGRRAVTFAGERPILDMPVGTAYFAVEAARIHDGIVVGGDIAEGMVVQARQVAQREGLRNLVPVQADAHALPFADGSFAAILCTNGLQVIPGLLPAVREIARVLAPGGMLYASVVTLPLSRFLPKGAGERMPTMLRSGLDVAETFSDAGIYVTKLERRRFATLLEAVKPVTPDAA